MIVMQHRLGGQLEFTTRPQPKASQEKEASRVPGVSTECSTARTQGLTGALAESQQMTGLPGALRKMLHSHDPWPKLGTSQRCVRNHVGQAPGFRATRRWWKGSRTTGSTPCPDTTQAPGFRATQWSGLREVVEERIEDHWVNTLPRHHAGSRVSCNTMARTEGGGGKDRGPLGQHLAQTPRRLQGFVQHNGQD